MASKKPLQISQRLTLILAYPAARLSHVLLLFFFFIINFHCLFLVLLLQFCCPSLYLSSSISLSLFPVLSPSFHPIYVEKEQHSSRRVIWSLGRRHSRAVLAGWVLFRSRRERRLHSSSPQDRSVLVWTCNQHQKGELAVGAWYSSIISNFIHCVPATNKYFQCVLTNQNDNRKCFARLT